MIAATKTKISPGKLLINGQWTEGSGKAFDTVNPATGEVLTQWGRHGRQPGQFKWVHNIAIDSKGNLYTAEVGWGRRAQKFRRMP